MNEHKFLTPTTCVAALIGAVIGFTMGRLIVRFQGDPVIKLTEAVIAQSTAATTGPIIATAIVAASAIIGSVVLPVIVLIVLRRGDKEEPEHAREQQVGAGVEGLCRRSEGTRHDDCDSRHALRTPELDRTAHRDRRSGRSDGVPRLEEWDSDLRS